MNWGLVAEYKGNKVITVYFLPNRQKYFDRVISGSVLTCPGWVMMDFGKRQRFSSFQYFVNTFSEQLGET